uniref:Hcy-binding domain-containing protein n=1 Tax=Graphocephala atropunctata TaxID=36148 RepID=A0A1B6KMJ4_9HEMI
MTAIVMEPVMLVDGGFSTQLSLYVGNCVDGDPLWSAKFLETNKQACIQTHRDFIRAGADILITNTYQASIEGFKDYLNLDKEESIELIKESVEFVKKAIALELGDESYGNQRRVLIAGSVGPYGAGLHDGSEYRGEYVETTSPDTIIAWHTPRIEALLDAGVDLLAIETIPALAEAEVLLNLLKKYPKAKAWLSFSCKDEEHTSHGERICDVAARCWSLNSNQLVAVGVNCLHPSYVTPLLKSIHKKLPKIPLIAYPNSGERYNAQLGQWEDKDKCVPVVNYIRSWLELGVQFIGGCCRTDAEVIRKFRGHIDYWIQHEKKPVRPCSVDDKICTDLKL